MTTTWMWPASNGGVRGVRLDPQWRIIEWYDDAAACACGESPYAPQSFSAFLDRGPLLPDIPDNIMAEMHTTLRTLAERV